MHGGSVATARTLVGPRHTRPFSPPPFPSPRRRDRLPCRIRFRFRVDAHVCVYLRVSLPLLLCIYNSIPILYTYMYTYIYVYICNIFCSRGTRPGGTGNFQSACPRLVRASRNFAVRRKKEEREEKKKEARGDSARVNMRTAAADGRDESCALIPLPRGIRHEVEMVLFRSLPPVISPSYFPKSGIQPIGAVDGRGDGITD